MSAPQDAVQQAPSGAKKTARVFPPKTAMHPPEPEEKTPEELEQEKLNATTVESVRKKLQSPPPWEEPGGEPEKEELEAQLVPDEQDVLIPPKPESEENKTAGEKPKSALPARPFEQSSREISGEAKLPDKDDELSVPMPSQDDKPPEPAPDDYAGAKEQFKRKIEQEEKKEDIRAESEETLEQYAKENLIWLYEIYKMGGMSREDFLDKVREQSHPGGQQETDAPPVNSALENLNRELGKKKK